MKLFLIFTIVGSPRWIGGSWHHLLLMLNVFFKPGEFFTDMKKPLRKSWHLSAFYLAFNMPATPRTQSIYICDATYSSCILFDHYNTYIHKTYIYIYTIYSTVKFKKHVSVKNEFCEKSQLIIFSLGWSRYF